MDDLLTTGDAARLLDVSSEHLRRMEARGVIESVARTRSGRLFSRTEVEALAAERAEKAREKAAS